MAKKRTVTDASEGTSRKKRKAAEASEAKIKSLAAYDEDDEDLHDDPTPGRSRKVRKRRNSDQDEDQGDGEVKVEDMPLLAPGFRFFEGFSDTIRNTEIAALTKAEPDVEQSRKYGFTLKPIIVTEGPFAGETMLLLRPTASFKFLDLPPEIRNMIYNYLIDEPETVLISSHKPLYKDRRPVVASFRFHRRHPGLAWDKRNGKWIGQTSTSHDLLRVSKQVQAETGRLLYGETTFEFGNWSDAHLWLDTVGSMRRFVRHINLLGPKDRGFGKAPSALRKLGDATDLQTMRLKHDHICPDTRSRWMYLGVGELVRIASPLLRILHKKFKAADSPRSVLDLIGVQSDLARTGKCVHCGGEGRCYMCREKIDHAKSCLNLGKCKVPCDEHEAHCKELAGQIRAAIAKELKIKV